MTLSLIVAFSKKRVIGQNNQLPWYISEDLKRFKRVTMGHPIIMGRKTYESIGKPLPGRENIVLTRDTGFSAPGVTVVHSVDAVMERVAGEPQQEFFVIGGGEVYALFLPHVSKLYLTVVDTEMSGDTHFPEIDWDEEFQVSEESEWFAHPAGGLRYQFVTGVRRG